MRKLITLLTTVCALVALALPASAWPAPTVTGDCDGWSVTETASDKDWKSAHYWTIDGVDGQFKRGQSVHVPDDSEDSERTFKVRWFDKKDKQLDKRSTTGHRELKKCEEPPPPPPHKTLECPGTLELKTVVRAKAGSETVLLTADVVEGSQGKTAAITAVAKNNHSVHPGNDLVVISGGGEVVMEDVERAKDVETPANGTLTLGPTVTIKLVMGEDEVFSGGMTVEFDCPEPVTVPSGSGDLVCEYIDGTSRAILSYEINDPDGVVTSVSPDEGVVEGYPFDGSSVTVTIEYLDEFEDTRTTTFEVDGLDEGCEPPPTTTPPTTAPPTTAPPTTAPPTTAPPTTEPPTTTTEPEPLPQPSADSNCEAFWVENVPGPGSVTAVYTPVGKGSVSHSVSVDTDFVERMEFRVLKADLGQDFSWSITVRSDGFEQTFEGKETDCAEPEHPQKVDTDYPEGAPWDLIGLVSLLGVTLSAPAVRRLRFQR